MNAPESAHVELLTVLEVAALMGVGKKTVYRFIARGEIRVVDVGEGRAKTRIRSDDYQSFIDARTRRARTA